MTTETDHSSEPGNMVLERWPLSRFQRYDRNSRTHDPDQIAALKASMLEFGWGPPILVRGETETIAAGHGRLTAAEELVAEGHDEFAEAPVLIRFGWSDAQFRAYVIADNKLATMAGWDDDILKIELGDLRDEGFDIDLTGFDASFLEGIGEALNKGPKGNLAERFGVVPFSVLSAREGWWQDRKKQWLALGIVSELGRGENLLAFSETMLEPDPEKRKKKAAGRVMGQDLLNGEGELTAQRGLTEKGQRVRDGLRHAPNALPAGGGGAGWKDPQFYAKKRKWEAEHGREISTEEFGAILWPKGQTEDLRGGLTHRTTTDPYRAKEAQAMGAQSWAQEHIESGMAQNQTGTSIFDPVLCELAYRWFCPPGGTVLDPFAGGSVRGLVASRLGRNYVGCDLRGEQIEANRAQAHIGGSGAVHWLQGDSRHIVQHVEGLALRPERGFDLIFSCPPYADLEVYSEDPADISTMEYPEFREAYFDIVAASASLLKADGFACFVVGEVRGKDGSYYGFVPDTIEAFRRAGLAFYNEAILVTAAGSLPMRTAKQFANSRKLGKTHQNILVFVKGSAKAATAAIGEVEFGAIPVDEIEPAEAEVSLEQALDAEPAAPEDDSEFGEALE